MEKIESTARERRSMLIEIRIEYSSLSPGTLMLMLTVNSFDAATYIE